MKKFLLCLPLLLTACGGSDAPQLYRLASDAPASATTCSRGPSITIHEPIAAPGLDSAHIIVLTGDGRQSFYNDIRWNAAAPSVVQHYLAERFEQSGRFALVTTDDASAHTGWLLQTQLRDFEVNQATEKLQINLTASLVNAATRQPVMSLPLSAEADISGKDTGEIVAAFNAQMAQLSDQMLQSFAGKIQSCH